MAEPVLLGSLSLGDEFRLSPEDGEVFVVTWNTREDGIIGVMPKRADRNLALYCHTGVYPLPPEQEKPPSTRLPADLIRLLEEWEPADD